MRNPNSGEIPPPLENNFRMMENDTRKHETMPLDLFQFARFKRPQLPAGRAPLLLNATAVSASEDVRADDEGTRQ